MKCASCGTINSVVTDECIGCGARLGSDQSVSLQSRPASQITPEIDRSYLPYILFALSVIYAISPVDLIPDVPLVGWIDDIILLVLAGSNMLEKGVGITNQNLKETLRLIKWAVVIIGVIAIAVLGLLGVVVYKLVWG